MQMEQNVHQYCSALIQDFSQVAMNYEKVASHAGESAALHKPWF